VILPPKRNRDGGKEADLRGGTKRSSTTVEASEGGVGAPSCPEESSWYSRDCFDNVVS
jgi:hypothetical protein